MSSRRTKLAAIGAGVAAATALGAGALASSASAATANIPAPHVCAYKLGPNVLKLTFNGTDFLYPTVLHVANNGVVTGRLQDGGLPAGHQVLRVNGLCVGSNLILDTNYPSADPQGSRSEDLVITSVSQHRGTAAGVWDETGTEDGTGAASFVFEIAK
jgi:hypothetical protein